jgi:biotin carboxylase
MTEENGVLLVISSGLRVYREYLMASAAERARAAGLGLWLINGTKPTWQSEYVEGTTVVNTFDHELLVTTARELAARRQVVGVLCWDEPQVLPSAWIADELGVPGLGIEGVQGCRDKYRTRRLLTEAGFHQPTAAMVYTADWAPTAAERIGYPVVVKPRALGASIGVKLAADKAELVRAFDIANAAGLVGDEPYRGGALVEEYVTGAEISVDAAVYKGEYLPMFVARKQTGLHPYFEELGHVVDATDPLLTDPELIDMLTAAHRILGVDFGITHTEVKLTEHGPLIVEVNGRLGGDLIPYLGKLATGIDAGEVLVDVLSGHRPNLDVSRAAVAGIRFGYPETDCVVREINVPTQAPGLVEAEAMVEPGTELRLPPGGYLARHSFVVCTADDTETCVDRLTTTSKLVWLDAEPIAPPAEGAKFTMPAGLLDVDES